MTDQAPVPATTYLTIREKLGDDQWHDHDLLLGEFRLGRGEEAEVRLQARDVSRLHAVVLVGPKGASIRDLDSKNGVFVNESRVQGERPLRHGDSIAIGSAVLDIRFPEHVLSGVLHDVGELTMTSVPRGKSAQAEEPARSLLVPIIGLAVGLLGLAALLLL